MTKNINIKTTAETITVTTDTHIESVWGGEVSLDGTVIGSFVRTAETSHRKANSMERSNARRFGQPVPDTIQIRVDRYAATTVDGRTSTGHATRKAAILFLLGK